MLATAPNRPCWGEVITTFCLITGLFFFLRHAKLGPFTPTLLLFLYALILFPEAPFSGTSTNPARSFGPALISGQWQTWSSYWLGPLPGGLLGLASLRISGLGWLKIEVANVVVVLATKVASSITGRRTFVAGGMIDYPDYARGR